LQSRIVIGMLALAVCFGCMNSPPTAPDPGAVAMAYADAGRYIEAGREIDLAVRTHPKNLELRRQAAEIHRKAGNTGKAVGHLEAALQLDPADAQAWLALAEIEKGRENLADAYVAFRRAAELDPQSLRAVSGLALSADELGFAEEAEDAYAHWAALEKELGVDSVPAAVD